MHPQKIIVILNPIFTLLNFYVANSVYNQGKLSYMYLLWIIFALEQLILLLSNKFRKLPILLNDIYLITKIFSQNEYNFRDQLQIKILVNVAPLVLLNSLYNIDCFPNENNQILILFSLQIFILLLGSLFFCLYYSEDNLRLKGMIHCFLALISYYLSLKSMINLKDIFEINVIYYQILIGLASLFLLCKHFPNVNLFNFLITIELFDGIISNFQIGYNQLNKRRFDFYQSYIVKFLSYFCQFFRLILILFCADLNQITSNFMVKDNVLLIQNLLTILAILSTLTYLIIEMKSLYKSIFTHKYILLSNTNDFNNISIQLGLNTKIIKKYYITFSYYLKITCNPLLINQYNTNEKQIEDYISQKEKGNYVEKCPYNRFQKAISYQLKLKKQIKIESINKNEQLCNCSIINLFVEEEHIHEMNYVLARIQCKANLIYIFFERYQNGYIFSKFTDIILSKFKGEEKMLYLEIISKSYSIILFQKKIKNILTTLPQFVQYDLFADD